MFKFVVNCVMKSKNLFISLCFIFYSLSLCAQQIEELRSLLQLSANDKTSCEKLFTLTLSDTKKAPIHLGYKGIAHIMKSKYEAQPKKKLHLYQQGQAMLEESIAQDSLSAELRMLRFIIQENCPSILKYNQDIEIDKAYLLNSYSSVKDLKLKKEIESVVNQSKLVSKNEKKMLVIKQ